MTNLFEILEANGVLQYSTEIKALANQNYQICLQKTASTELVVNRLVQLL